MSTNTSMSTGTGTSTVVTSPARSAGRRHAAADGSPTAAQRLLGVVIDPDSFRHIAYLLLGLPMGIVWFTALTVGVSVGLGMVVVALVGIPMLVGVWYAARAFANVERVTARVLLKHDLETAPMRTTEHGNPWNRLRSMSADRDRWREVGYLVLRLPLGIATFTVAVTALVAPIAVALAPVVARYDDGQPFGDWALSSRLEDVASGSPWSWGFVPLGLAMMVGAFHLLRATARVCGRWAASWLTLPPE